jgi:hypothetical protein
MAKTALSESTIIEIGKSIPLYDYIAFFEQATCVALPFAEFQLWLNTQVGKPVGQAFASFREAAVRKNMPELMTEERFGILSETDKMFIKTFDKRIGELGYDCGGGIGAGYVWGKFMIVYSKTGAKTKKVAARIYIREDGIALRLFLNNVDKHRTYIERAAAHIKDVFTDGFSNCTCKPQKENCRMRKAYTVVGTSYEKCSGEAFVFWNPTTARLPDYINLLAEFYPPRRTKSAQADRAR